MSKQSGRALRILLATGGPTLPQMIGGSQRTGDTLLRGLRERGHEVALTGALVGSDWIGWRARLLMKLTGRRAIVDHTQGYPVYRSWFPYQTAAEVVADFRPNAVVVQAHSTGLMGQAFHELDQPLLFSFQDVEFQEHGYDLGKLQPLTGVANSQYTAEAYRAAFDATSTVIHPMIDGAQYRVEHTGKHVTFINPSPVKGVDIAIATAAALPDIPFRFQEAWPMPPSERQELLARLAVVPNVTLVPQVGDMREVYRDTRILFCPSQWQEGYGRIATEAQFSGIPVIGSDRGGLPEAIGDGGIVLPAAAPVNDWAAAIRSLWDDDAVYREFGARATAYANREALQLERQLDQWEDAIREVARFDHVGGSRQEAG